MINQQNGNIDLNQSFLLFPGLHFKELEKSRFYLKERKIWRRSQFLLNFVHSFSPKAWDDPFTRLDIDFMLVSFRPSHVVSVQRVSLDPSIAPGLEGKFYRAGHIRMGMKLFFHKNLLKQIHFWFGDENITGWDDIYKNIPDYGIAKHLFWHKLLETDLGKPHFQSTLQNVTVKVSYSFSWGEVEWQVDPKFGGNDEIVIKYNN